MWTYPKGSASEHLARGSCGRTLTTTMCSVAAAVAGRRCLQSRSGLREAFSCVARELYEHYVGLCTYFPSNNRAFEYYM